MTTSRVPVASLSNLGAAFTEVSIEVWCDVFEKVAATNFDGGAHFCQFCGSTQHAPATRNEHAWDLEDGYCMTHRRYCSMAADA